jgi:C4-dicarboxylate-specific signal transduction histidine kinase
MENERIIKSQFSFIGKVLSVCSHEINNHLAVIKESAGLIEDLLQSGNKPSPKDIIKIVRTIENQIEKSAHVCDKLHDFGHDMGCPTPVFSPNNSMEDLLVLIHRLAYQKRISIEKDFARWTPTMQSSQLKLQFTVFCIIEKYLRRLDKNSRIIVKTTSSNDSIRISVIPKGNFIEINGEETCNDEIYCKIVEQLGGSISQKNSDEETTITLPVPPPAGGNRS